MRRQEHSNHGVLSMESVIEPESTWLIVVRNIQANMDQDHEVDSFLVDLKTHLTSDGCMLHISKNSPRLIVLRIHCPEVVMDAQVQSLRLAHTEDYLDRVFGAANVMIRKNSIASLHQKKRPGLLEQFLKKKKEQPLTADAVYRTMNVQEDAVWNLERIASRAPGEEDGYLYFGDGAGVDVYVLDTGIVANHQEFGGRATFLHNAIPDGIFTDCNGHGTHVAGIVGSATYGVAKGVHLYGVRVLNCSGDGSIDDILEGADVIIEKAASQPPGRRGVINLSLGGDKSDIIEVMITALRDAGLVVVLAAGNSGADACQFSPSNMGLKNYALTVGASNRNDQRPSWSNYGSCVSITAPGADIKSTWFTSTTATATISGTSMAAPAVSGVAALVLQQNSALSVEAVNQKIVEWATPGAVAAASRTGGGSSLLYSRIEVNLAPEVVRKQIGLIPSHHSNDASTSVGGAGAILCVSITLLWLLCMA